MEVRTENVRATRAPRALRRLATSGLLAVIALGCIPVAAQSDDHPRLARYEYAQVEMGMQFKLILYSAEQEAANRAAHDVFVRIGELNRILSDYDPASELSRLSDTAGTGQAVRVSDDLWAVLARSQTLAQQTDGAFDVSVGPIVKLWRRARRAKEMPDPKRLEEARAAVGYKGVRLDRQAHTVELLRPAIRLDLGGIAAGYAIDEAMRILKHQGITRALIDASGDILVSDPPPGQSGWRIGVAPLEGKDAPPSRYLLLNNCAVTTSGDGAQFVELAGKRYSHIVDPRTGLGLTDHASVTVVAADGISADCLATAACVLGPERGLTLLESYPKTAAIFIRGVEEHREIVESPTLKAYFAPGE